MLSFVVCISLRIQFRLCFHYIFAASARRLQVRSFAAQVLDELLIEGGNSDHIQTSRAATAHGIGSDGRDYSTDTMTHRREVVVVVVIVVVAVVCAELQSAAQ